MTINMFLGVSFGDAKLKPFDYSEFDAICSIVYHMCICIHLNTSYINRLMYSSCKNITWELLGKKLTFLNIFRVIFSSTPKPSPDLCGSKMSKSPPTWIIVHLQATAFDHSRGTAFFVGVKILNETFVFFTEVCFFCSVRICPYNSYKKLKSLSTRPRLCIYTQFCMIWWSTFHMDPAKW